MAAKFIHRLNLFNDTADTSGGTVYDRLQEALLKTGMLQNALKSTNFSSIVTDEKGVIQMLNVGAERMLGYGVIARAKALSVELETVILPGFEISVFKASRGIEDIYGLTCIRKDGNHFPAIVSVTTLRDAQNAIVGYLLIGTYFTVRKQTDKVLLKAGAMKSAILQQRQFIESGLMSGSTSPTSISPKGAASYGYSRLSRNHDSDRHGQRYRCCAGEELANTNKTDKYDD